MGLMESSDSGYRGIVAGRGVYTPHFARPGELLLPDEPTLAPGPATLLTFS